MESIHDCECGKPAEKLQTRLKSDQFDWEEGRIYGLLLIQKVYIRTAKVMRNS